MRAAPPGLSDRAARVHGDRHCPADSGLDPATRSAGSRCSSRSGATTTFGDPEAPRRALAASVYGDMYGIASRVTAGAPTMYDAVKRVERYLNRNFTYSEKPRAGRVPAERVPVPRQVRLLPAVLGRDGADAAHGRHPQPRGGRLRARLAQPRHRRVPRARPGRALLGRGLLQRDRLGPVRPDARGRAGAGRRRPTPRRPRHAAARSTGRAGAAAPERAAEGASSPAADSDGGASPWLLLPLVLVGGAGLIAWPGCCRRAGRLEPGRAGRGAAGRAAPRARPARLGRPGRHHAARPRAPARPRRRPGRGALRGRRCAQHRYDPRSPAAPTLRERRELRRDLTARGGLRGAPARADRDPAGRPAPGLSRDLYASKVSGLQPLL